MENLSHIANLTKVVILKAILMPISFDLIFFIGLFHRAIVMSGTALADWSVTGKPLRYTLQAAQQMNCPLVEQDDELATCLRFKKVTELMNIRLQAPLYASPLAPVVDGIVVPNEPRQSMKTYKELFGRYTLGCPPPLKLFCRHLVYTEEITLDLFDS